MDELQVSGTYITICICCQHVAKQVHEMSGEEQEKIIKPQEEQRHHGGSYATLRQVTIIIETVRSVSSGATAPPAVAHGRAAAAAMSRCIADT